MIDEGNIDRIKDLIPEPQFRPIEPLEYQTNMQPIEWYEARHSKDLNEIERLNTTIDVLIQKIADLMQ